MGRGLAYRSIIAPGPTYDVPNSVINPADHAFVVPAYGDSPFLPGCLASLRAQWLSSRILITTSTPSPFIEAAAGVAGVNVKVNAVRSGIAADWNYALDVADCRYVTLAHQDDIYAPDFLAQSLNALARGKGGLCFTGYQEIDDAGSPKSSKISRVKHLIDLAVLGRAREVRGARLRAYLSFGNPLPCSSVTFDLLTLAGFRFSNTYASDLDWDAWWRLMEADATFVRLPDRLVGRRHNALTATTQLQRDGTRALEDVIMFRRAWPWPLAEALAAAYRLAG